MWEKFAVLEERVKPLRGALRANINRRTERLQFWSEHVNKEHFHQGRYRVCLVPKYVDSKSSPHPAKCIFEPLFVILEPIEKHKGKKVELGVDDDIQERIADNDEDYGDDEGVYE